MNELRWFRLHAEMIDDAKIRLLAFEDRWHFVAIMCCKAQGWVDKDTTPEMRDRWLGVKLGLASRELDEVKRRLMEVGLIDANWQPVAWEGRQYVKTDHDGAERAKRSRDKQRDCNVTESHASVSVSDSGSSLTLKSKIQREYPKGIWRQTQWQDAEHYWNVSLDRGAVEVHILSGVHRYNLQQTALGNIGTQYILGPVEFFRKELWKEEFPIPRPAGEPPPEDPEQRKYLDEMRKKLLGD